MENTYSPPVTEFAQDFVRIKLPGIRFDNGRYRTQSGDREIMTPIYEMAFFLPKDAKTIQDVWKANMWIEHVETLNGIPVREWEFVKVYVDNYLLRKELHNLKAKFNSK